MTNKEAKLDFIQSLYQRNHVFIRQVNDTEYVTRCPYCGDSSNENSGHFYIRVNPDDNLPIMFNCFKCEEKGIVRSDTLSLLDIDDANLKNNISNLNKTSDKLDNKNILSGVRNLYFDYSLPEIKRGEKTKYIEDRLGLKLNNEDLKRLKVITSLKGFLLLNGIKSITVPNEIAFMLEKNYVGFLSNGNSHILFRDITDKQKYRWVKYPITKKSMENRLFYSIATEIDIFDTSELIINLAEGVMDIASVCYNLDYSASNIMNIAVSGKYYERIILYLVDMGLVGDNIKVNIFADNDVVFNKKKGKQTTTLEHYRKMMMKYKHLFSEVNVYYNIISKDVGVPRNEISLKKYKL